MPTISSRKIAEYTDVLERFLGSPEKATAPDQNDVVMSDNGTIVNLGWLRSLTADLRQVTKVLGDMEPQDTVSPARSMTVAEGRDRFA